MVVPSLPIAPVRRFHPHRTGRSFRGARSTGTSSDGKVLSPCYLHALSALSDMADAGRMDEEGYVFVMARTDDVMNVAGHRLSSGQMEEILQDHPSVAESAVVAVPDTLRGHVPVGLAVLESGPDAPAISESQLETEIVAAVRARVGAVACFKRVLVVPRLPKTRSGKVLRNVLRGMAEGRADVAVPPTIEDASVLNEVRSVMQKHDIGTVDSSSAGNATDT
jgi:propionyl-CoA synthetase